MPTPSAATASPGRSSFVADVRGKCSPRAWRPARHAGTIGPIEPLAVLPGDLVSLLIGPRDGNHGCDLTDLELTLTTIGDDARDLEPHG